MKKDSIEKIIFGHFLDVQNKKLTPNLFRTFQSGFLM